MSRNDESHWREPEPTDEEKDAAMCGECGGIGCWWCDQKGHFATQLWERE